ncbi:MAG TPA: YceI family protein [Ohtaekwangia sp.]|nr:YceI family protein [Ohtaekwangia sp.]
MMKRFVLLIVIFLVKYHTLYPQRYVADKGMVDFFSQATLEDIKAENRKVQSIFNASTGEIAFRVGIRDFEFKKKMMQEHFNEKYMESDKYPDATFSGTIEGFSPDEQGWQNVTAKGDLKIHGVTHKVEVPGTLRIVDAGNLQMRSEFIVKLEDYGVTIPQILWQNIAEQVKVTIELNYRKN